MKHLRYNPFAGLLILVSVFSVGAVALAQNIEQPAGYVTGTTYYAGTQTIQNPNQTSTNTPVDPQIIQTHVPNTVGTIKTTGFGFSLKKINHLAFTSLGEGRTCEAGDTGVIEYRLAPGVYPATIIDLGHMVPEVFHDDHRLREIQIADNRLVMHYILPARLFGVIPMNYVLLVEADAPSMTIHLVYPSWLKWATTGNTLVDASFANTVPTLLTKNVVNSFGPTDTIARHSKLIEVIARSMYGAEVYPYPSSIWFCYILPYLIFIIAGLLALFVYLWFAIRSYRRRRRVKHIVEYHLHKKNQGELPHVSEREEELPTIGRVGGTTETPSELVFGSTRVVFENKHIPPEK